MPQEITTPVGRIVWGHPTRAKGKTRKNPATNAIEPVMKADGTQVMVRSFGLAITKDEFQAQVWPALSAEAAALYPGGAPPQKFAWKYTDCDQRDDNGKLFSEREGYAGCYVLAFSSELDNPPPVFKFNGSTYDQLPGDAIKCGDWVAVKSLLKGNIPADRTMTPGIYVNPQGIEFVGYGTEIVAQGSINPNDAFGGQARQLPPGASATPVGAPAGAPGMPVGSPAPMTAPPPGPGAMPGQTPPPVMAPPPAPAPAAAPAMTRPTDPAWIANAGTAAEQWWNGTVWVPAVVAPAGAPGLMPPR